MKALKIIAGLLGLALLITGGTAFMAWNAFNPAPPPLQAFVNGNIITLDDHNTIAEAVLIHEGKIVGVGSTADITQKAGPDADIVDLGGATMMPGFVDAHGHFPAGGIYAVAVDANSPPIGEIKTIDQITAKLAEKAATAPKGKWLLGWGYDDTMLNDMRHPSRVDLDRASTEHPILLLHISGHMGVVNTKALEVLGIDARTPNPNGGEIIRDELSGAPTGLLMETAVYPAQAAAMSFTPSEMLAIISEGSLRYLQQGVTTAQVGLADPAQFGPQAIAARLGLISQRLVLFPEASYALEMAEKGTLYQHEGSKVHVAAAKIVGDGSIQGYTGFLGAPYHVIPDNLTSDYRGYPIHKSDALNILVERLYANNITPAIHGNGDAAIDMILTAVKRAREAQPQSKDLRPILIHAQMMRQDQIALAKQLNVTPSFFSAHVYYWGDRHRDIFMGPDRATNISPMKWAQQAGLRFSVHLDAPVVPMHPFTMVWSSVSRRTANGDILGAEQGIDVLSALRATTIDAAWQAGLDDKIGSVEVGKLADLIIVDADPLSVPPAALKDIKVTRTLIGGVTFHHQP